MVQGVCWPRTEEHERREVRRDTKAETTVMRGASLPSRLAYPCRGWELSDMHVERHETEALRRMTAAEKLRVMTALIQQAYTLKAAALRAQWPDWSEAEVQDRTRALVGGDGP